MFVALVLLCLLACLVAGAIRHERNWRAYMRRQRVYVVAP